MPLQDITPDDVSFRPSNAPPPSFSGMTPKLPSVLRELRRQHNNDREVSKVASKTPLPSDMTALAKRFGGIRLDRSPNNSQPSTPKPTLSNAEPDVRTKLNFMEFDDDIGKENIIFGPSTPESDHTTIYDDSEKPFRSTSLSPTPPPSNTLTSSDTESHTADDDQIDYEPAALKLIENNSSPTFQPSEQSHFEELPSLNSNDEDASASAETTGQIITDYVLSSTEKTPEPSIEHLALDPHHVTSDSKHLDVHLQTSASDSTQENTDQNRIDEPSPSTIGGLTLVEPKLGDAAENNAAEHPPDSPRRPEELSVMENSTVAEQSDSPRKPEEPSDVMDCSAAVEQAESSRKSDGLCDVTENSTVSEQVDSPQKPEELCDFVEHSAAEQVNSPRKPEELSVQKSMVVEQIDSPKELCDVMENITAAEQVNSPRKPEELSVEQSMVGEQIDSPRKPEELCGTSEHSTVLEQVDSSRKPEELSDGMEKGIVAEQVDSPRKPEELYDTVENSTVAEHVDSSRKPEELRDAMEKRIVAEHVDSPRKPEEFFAVVEKSTFAEQVDSPRKPEELFVVMENSTVEQNDSPRKPEGPSDVMDCSSDVEQVGSPRNPDGLGDVMEHSTVSEQGSPRKPEKLFDPMEHSTVAEQIPLLSESKVELMETVTDSRQILAEEPKDRAEEIVIPKVVESLIPQALVESPIPQALDEIDQCTTITLDNNAWNVNGTTDEKPTKAEDTMKISDDVMVNVLDKVAIANARETIVMNIVKGKEDVDVERLRNEIGKIHEGNQKWPWPERCEALNYTSGVIRENLDNHAARQVINQALPEISNGLRNHLKERRPSVISSALELYDSVLASPLSSDFLAKNVFSSVLHIAAGHSPVAPDAVRSSASTVSAYPSLSTMLEEVDDIDRLYEVTKKCSEISYEEEINGQIQHFMTMVAAKHANSPRDLDSSATITANDERELRENMTGSNSFQGRIYSSRDVTPSKISSSVHSNFAASEVVHPGQSTTSNQRGSKSAKHVTLVVPSTPKSQVARDTEDVSTPKSSEGSALRNLTPRTDVACSAERIRSRRARMSWRAKLETPLLLKKGSDKSSQNTLAKVDVKSPTRDGSSSTRASGQGRMYTTVEVEEIRQAAIDSVIENLEKTHKDEIDRLANERHEVTSTLEKERFENHDLRSVLEEYELTMNKMVSEKNTKSNEQTCRLVAENNKLKAEMLGMQEAFEQLKERYDKGKQMIDLMTGKETRLIEQNSELKKDLVQWQTYADKLKQNSEKKLNKAFDSVTAYRTSCLEQEAHAKKALCDLAKAQSDLKKETANHDETVKKLAQSTASLHNEQDACAQFSSEVATLKANRSRIIAEKERKVGILEDAQTELIVLRNKVADLEPPALRAEEFKRQLDIVRSERQNLKAKAFDDITLIRDLEEKLQAKENEVEDLSGICNEAMNQLEAAKRGMGVE